MLSLIKKIIPRTHLLMLRPEGFVRASFGLVWPGVGRQGRAGFTVQEYFMSEGASRRDVLLQIRADLAPKREDNIYLGLPLEYFSLLQFELPRAAQENLEQAVVYALMRHVPMDLDALYYNFQTRMQGDILLVSAVVAPKKGVQPFLEEVSSAGLLLSGVLPSLALLAWSRQDSGLYLTQSPPALFIDGSLPAHGSGEQENLPGESWDILAWEDGQIVYQASDSFPAQEGFGSALQQAVQSLANLGRPLQDVFVWSLSDFREEDPVSFAGLEDLRITALGPDLPLLTPARGFPFLIDLVPRATLRQRKLAFAFQLAMFVFFLLSLCSYPLAGLMGLKARVQRLSQEVERVRVQANELSGLRQENEQIKAFFKATLNRVGSRVDLCEVLKELTEILPANTWLQSFSFSRGWIRIEGESKSATAVVELVERSPLFKDASFDSPVSKRGGVEAFKIVAQVEK